MIRKQLILAAGALAALLVVILAGEYTTRLFSWVVLPPDELAGRLAFAARWLLLPGFTLLVGVVGAARRGFYKDAIDGTRMPANHALEINLRYNMNTLEQLVLAAIAWGALVVTMPYDRLLFIPAMASLFVFGRVTFWIGYLMHPLGRAFGMALTAIPTLAAYAWLTWRAMRG